MPVLSCFTVIPMREVILDCGRATDSEKLHQVFAQALYFPQWYGGTLDALYDCLTDLPEPTHVILRNFHGPNAFRETLLDAADTDLGFSVTFE
jgi:ribonuclease inhibitor